MQIVYDMNAVKRLAGKVEKVAGKVISRATNYITRFFMTIICHGLLHIGLYDWKSYEFKIGQHNRVVVNFTVD